MVNALLVTGLLAVVYSIGLAWLTMKVRSVHRMEFSVLPFLDETGPVPYYAIAFRLDGTQWREASELLEGYKSLWSNYQQEILTMKFRQEKEALPFLREFEASIRDISTWKTIWSKKK